MKNKILLAVVSAFIILPSAFGQGALTPPGAPAPTMKSLAQIEPRTAISAAPFTIAQSGAYYLTTNVFASSNAIVIAANGVSLDLGGWTISSTAPNATTGGTAILLVGGLKNVTIQNGFIQGGVTNNGSGVFGGGGFGSGIHYSGNQPVNVLVTKVLVSGCLLYGINLSQGDSTVVEDCTVRTVGNWGIFASTIRGSRTVDCGYTAIIGDLVADCHGECVGNSYGISATVALNCYGSGSPNGAGIHADTAQNCYGYSTNGTGIYVSSSAQNCYGYSANYSGISLKDDGTLIGCTANSSATGITAGNRCTIKDCTASNNSTNGIVAGQSCRVSGCTASSNGTGATGIGISTGIRTTIESCTVNDNQGDGILAVGDCTVLDNHASHNALGVATAAGIHATGAGNRIDGNHTRDNVGYGIKSDGGAGADTIIRNTSGGNSVAQYSPSSGSTFAPVQTPATMTNPSANF